ncbi:MAG: membrane integrity-associated transporter subunit PqiC [Alphaproteobacteria bacterium]|nr:membrane integrity-associated transporter subunit PqiC [Alphaproteobacteria bacterium]
MIVLRPLALILLAVVLVSCGGAPPPAEHFYRLSAPVLAPAAKPLTGLLIVERLGADGVTGERPMVHTRQGQEKNLETYRYHYWIEAPGRMLAQHLAEALGTSKAASKVVTGDLRVEGDWILKGRLKHFEQVLGGSRPKVLIEIEATLLSAKDYGLVHHASYREEEEAQGESPAQAVDALQKAFNRISLRIAADLKAP